MCLFYLVSSVRIAKLPENEAKSLKKFGKIYPNW